MTEINSAAGNRWVYLNGQIGHGIHHWQIADELARKTGIPEMEVSRITNKLVRGDTSDLDMYDLAIGRMFNGRPYIDHSTVDRNHIYDAIMDNYTSPIPQPEWHEFG